MRKPSREIMARAWELHRRNGHPAGYDGPCWGPTEAEIEEATMESEAKGS